MTKEFYGATVEAQRRVNTLLSLPATGGEQDWEFELADPNRIGDMIKAASAELSLDEKCALALITIASIEGAVEADDVDASMIEQAKAIIKSDRDVYAAMKFYWIEQGRCSNDAATRILDQE